MPVRPCVLIAFDSASQRINIEPGNEAAEAWLHEHLDSVMGAAVEMAKTHPRFAPDPEHVHAPPRSGTLTPRLLASALAQRFQQADFEVRKS